MIALLAGVTAGYLAVCLHIRQLTWRCQGERATTVAIAALAASVILLLPATAALNVGLHVVTGMWNLPGFLAHVCVIVAVAAVVYTVTWRIQEDNELRDSFRTWVELPSILSIALMFAFLSRSNGARVHVEGFYQVPMDLWMRLYWLTLCGTVCVLLGRACRGMLYLRSDPDSRMTATIYLWAAGFGIVALIMRGVQAVAFHRQAQAMLPTGFGCVAMLLVAWGSAVSWQRKIAWFTTHETWQIVVPRAPKYVLRLDVQGL